MSSGRLVLILAVGVVAYSNSLSGPFVLDDVPAIAENASIRDLSLPSVLAPVRGLPVSGRPLVNLSLAINYAVGDLDVRGYHVWNIAVHLLCALLLFGIVRQTLESPALRDRWGARSRDLAFASALLWMLHPLNTEAVDYLIQRTESMMAFFFLLTLYAAGRAGWGRSRRAGWEWTAVAGCALGMLCKESMVTAPVIVVLYDRVFIFDSWSEAFRRRRRLYAGLAASWVVLAAINWSAPRGNTAGFSPDVTPVTYLLNQASLIVNYLRLSVWPRSLVVSYGVPLPIAVHDIIPQFGVVGLLMILTIVALVFRPALGFLGAWFFITLAPTSSVIPIATEVGAERRMYLPLAAVVVFFVVCASAVLDRLKARPPVRVAILTACACLLLAGTMIRNNEYSSALTLAQTVLDRGRRDVGHFMFGTELLAAGRYDEAIPHLKDSLGGDPRAGYALGTAQFKAGKLDDAVVTLRAFVRDHPEFLEVVSARMIVGRSLLAEGRHADAVDEFQGVLRMVPSYVDAHGGLADALIAGDRYGEASAHYREFLRAHPQDFVALTKLGIAQATLGRMDDAVDAFQRALAVNPQNEDARRNLATALADKRERDLANRDQR